MKAALCGHLRNCKLLLGKDQAHIYTQYVTLIAVLWMFQCTFDIFKNDT